MSEEAPRIAKADFEKEIVKMAAEDKEFRAQLLANPTQALKEAVGLAIVGLLSPSRRPTLTFS